MAGIVLSNLAGATITYNGVQFGGADSEYKSTPPTYQFRGEFNYDESGRIIESVTYTLNVEAIFYESDEALLAINADELRRKLSQAGAVLKIEGLGTAFDTIDDDIDWGPRPQSFSWTPLGQVAWQCNWSVRFTVSECATITTSAGLAFVAFNFETTYENDFEGIGTRTISGYAKIKGQRSAANARLPTNVADDIRGFILIATPLNFRRTRNVWRENQPHDRIDFVVVDEQLPGDYLPEGITQGDGEVTFESQGPGFAQSVVTLNMTLKSAPGRPKSLAGITFLTAAISKQNAMKTANPTGTVVPIHLRLSNGKFDRARVTSGSMAWTMTKCINEMMKAAGIWEPVGANDGNLWRTSVQALWGNYGTSNVRSNVNDAIIVDLCLNATYGIINGTGIEPAKAANTDPTAFTCPEVPADGGWLGHELHVRVLREDEQSWHKKALSYLPAVGAPTSSGAGVPGPRIPIGGPVYTQTAAADKHLIEYHGLPAVYVLLQFKGLRIGNNMPVLPEINSVAGNPVVLEKMEVDGPRHAFDLLTCPVWFIRGYRVYRVNGYVPDLKKVDNKNSCAAPAVDEQNY